MTMTLRQQMAHDAVAVLNTEELGERATWSNGTSSQATLVRVVEQGERQTIRRASVFAVHGDRGNQCGDYRYPLWSKIVTLSGVAAGDTFTVVRGAVTTVYRVMYLDAAETALQRHICHVQLPSLVTFMDRERFKSLRGADEFIPVTGATQYRAKFVLSDAEHVSRRTQRKMRSTWQVFAESLPTLTTDMILVDADGRGYKIEQVEQPLERIDLPYLMVSRSDA